MMESTQDKIQRLLFGLADQAIKRGVVFTFDGSRIHAEEVANLGMNSIVCLANDMAGKLGVGALGIECSLTGERKSALEVFPLDVDFGDVEFIALAPFVTEVFERGVVMSKDASHDMIEVFESAARIVNPAYTTFPRAATFGSSTGLSVSPAFDPQ